jgi:hypothetical protein
MGTMTTIKQFRGTGDRVKPTWERHREHPGRANHLQAKGNDHFCINGMGTVLEIWRTQCLAWL